MIWGRGPAVSDWDRLLAEARDGAVLAHEPMHGELHWRGVAWAGLRIAELREGLRPDVMVAFGLLHDCRRETDDWDPEHGDRAARVAARSGPLKRLLGAEGRDLVAEACRLHERGRKGKSPAEPASPCPFLPKRQWRPASMRRG